jgi:hypothetical protein
MFGFKCFIFSFFLWLSFASPEHFNGVTSTLDNQVEITTSSIDFNNQALIVCNHLKTNRVNFTLKTFKIPYTYSNDKLLHHIDKTYDYKLIYLEIGNAIPLKLTFRKLLFPFHFFT